MDIGDKVTYKDGSYDGMKMTIASVAGDRISISRVDASGREWRRYEDAKDLKRVK